MTSRASLLRNQKWTKDDYFVSTDPSLIPLSKLNAVLASKETYWATALPEDALKEMVESSLCFALYKASENPGEPPSDMFGFARLVTDFTTFAWLTDVWVDPGLQGLGLGKWILQCVNESVDAVPHLRRTMCLCSWGRAVSFYESTMDMEATGDPTKDKLAVMTRLGKNTHLNH